MVQPRAGQGAVQIALRLPPELRDQIKSVADQNGRSINSEIISRLEASLTPESPPSGIGVLMVEDGQQRTVSLREMLEKLAKVSESIKSSDDK